MAFEFPILMNGTHQINDSSVPLQYAGVNYGSTGLVQVVSGAGVAINGVLQNDPSSSGEQQASLMQLGVSRMVAGAELSTPGIALMVDSSGRAVAQTGSNVIIGYLEDTAAASGDLCSVRLV